MEKRRVTLFMDVYPDQKRDFVAFSLPPFFPRGKSKRYQFTVEIEIPDSVTTDLGNVATEEVTYGRTK